MIAPSFTVGPVTLYWYSLFLLAGIAAGYALARPEAGRYGISSERLLVSIFYGVIPGLIGARLYHVVDQWPYYADAPLLILQTWHGGLGIIGGLAGGFLGLWYYASRHRIPLLRLLDVWAPAVLLAQAIGRFGNWTNQEAFGPPTDRPWGIFIEPANRPGEYLADTYFHPTFFYEAGFNFVALAFLLAIRPRLRATPGRVLGTYLVLYGLGRFVVEFFRIDTAALDGIPVAQLVAVGLVSLGAYLLQSRPTSRPPGRGRPRRARAAGQSADRG